MSRSDIDAIFAARPTKKIKASPAEQHESPALPDTVLDPSRKRAPRRQRREKKRDGFQDSRGPAPRRKTADGYSIYKEDELRISTTGGDTPLCPFDCQCCF